MNHGYLGVIVEQCLRDTSVLSRFDILARKQPRSWAWVLVAVAAEGLTEHIKLLQGYMVVDDTWYAHYFAGDELVVVYREAVFTVTCDPATWAPAVEFGTLHGIPPEQLDFHPRSRRGAEQFFGLRLR